jgi:hypothetical protein
VFNKFEKQQMTGENIDSRFERYRSQYLDQGINDVFRMRAWAAHVATWGFRALQGCGGLAAMMLPETRNHTDFQTASNLLSEPFGSNWGATMIHIPKPVQQQMLDDFLSKLRSDSQVDQVIISSVLRSLTRSVPEAGLKCVKRVEAILSSNSLGLKLRLASAENAEELYQRLPKPIASISDSTMFIILDLPKLINDVLIEVIDKSVTEMLPGVQRRTKESIDEVERSGPRKPPNIQRNEYFRIEGTQYGPFSTSSEVKYANIQDAERARDLAIAKARSIVSEAVIEKRVEQERQRVFTEHIQSTLTTLNSQLNWSSRTDHTRETMRELRTILRMEFSEIQLSPVAPDPFYIVALAYESYDSWWIFWKNYYSVVHFTGLRKLVEELLNRRYNPEFKTNLIAKSHDKVTEACNSLAKSLKGVMGQLQNMHTQVRDERPQVSVEVLKMLIEQLSELQGQGKACHEKLQENIAKLGNQRTCVK